MLADAEIESSNDGLSTSRLSKNCLNCEEVLDGEFCKMCGQAASTERYSLSTLAQEIYTQLRKVEAAKTLRTIWSLTISPGHFVRDYLNGKRVSHINPVRFFFYAFFIEVTVKLTVFSAFPNNPIVERVQSGLTIELMNFVLTIVWGLIWSVLYYKEELNLVEYIVAAIFFVAHTFLLSSFVLLLMLPFSSYLSHPAASFNYIDLGVYFGYSCVFAYALFNARWPMLILKQSIVAVIFLAIILALFKSGLLALVGFE